MISENYDVVSVQCKFLVRGVGDTYLVESPEDRYILRIYRSSHRSLAQIKEEVDLLLALKQAEVPVSHPVCDRSGKPIQTLDAVEGQRHAVLFSYAAGHPVRTLNDNQLLVLGREMARFHNISSKLEPGTARWSFDMETTLYRPLERIKPAFETDPEGYSWLQQKAQLAEKRLMQQDTSGFSRGYCHFDFLPKNFHFDGDRVTFFDFDFMGYGWLVNDIMSFWQHLTLDVYTNRTTQNAADEDYAIFLDGYRRYRSLSNQELEAVPYLSLGFWLFYMGFHTTHDQFHAYTQPSHVKLYTGFLKHIVSTYWKNEEKE